MNKNIEKNAGISDAVQDLLHQPVRLEPYAADSKLPLVWRKRYRLYLLSIGQFEGLLAEPKEDISLNQLRSQHMALENFTGLTCVFYLEKMTYYARSVMIKEGIPFIWDHRQVYLPFLGTIIDTKADRDLKNISRISFLTQKLLLLSLYEKWKNVTVTEAAAKLGVSKMSVSRCFDELEVLSVPYVRKSGTRRLLTADDDKQEMWEVIKPILRSPLIKEYYLREKIHESMYLLSGYSALSAYGMLDDNHYVTYAITKSELSAFRDSSFTEIVRGEEPASIVQEIGYMIPFRDKKIVDPLTVSLLIPENDREDPRVDKAIDEMLEEYVW